MPVRWGKWVFFAFPSEDSTSRPYDELLQKIANISTNAILYFQYSFYISEEPVLTFLMQHPETVKTMIVRTSPSHPH